MNKSLTNKKKLVITVTLILVLIGGVLFSFSKDLLYKSLNSEHYLDTIRISSSLQQNYLFSIHYTLSKVLGRTDGSIRDSLKKSMCDDNCHNFLDEIAKTTKSSLVYFMNQDGKVIGSTTLPSGKSIVGNNYSFRPYFQNAIIGNSFVYSAVGMHTKKRGIYYSSPVYESRVKENILGVLVFKVDIAPLDEFFKGYDDTIFLANPRGVVFATNRSEWLFSIIPSLTRKDSYVGDKQLGDQKVRTTLFHDGIKSGRISFDGKEYDAQVERIEILNDYWSLISLRSFDSGVYRTILIAIVAFIVMFTLLINFTILYFYKDEE